MKTRIDSIDFLRGLAMILMALDHVRLFLGQGTWYADPTDLASTTPVLFFTRWVTHVCAPVFVFLAGTSAFLSGTRRANVRALSRFLLARGLWLVLAELTIVNFAWTLDVTFSFRLLQVIWAIGIGLIVLSLLVYLPKGWILAAGLALVFGHNLLDPISASGSTVGDLIWYALHQPAFLVPGKDRVVSILYPVLPWIGLMAAGYACGSLYAADVREATRRRWLVMLGAGLAALFLILRGFNLYGEPVPWDIQSTPLYSLMSFLNTTKYPPSLHFLLMTLGPALILLAVGELYWIRFARPVLLIGQVPFFFYVVHLYLIHGLAALALVMQGRDGSGYILTAGNILSGRLREFGFDPGTVNLVWILVLLVLYPLCVAYRKFRENHARAWWASYL